MSKEIEEILNNVIEDFNGKWTNRFDEEEGISEYAKQINKLSSVEKDKEIKRLKQELAKMSRFM